MAYVSGSVEGITRLGVGHATQVFEQAVQGVHCGVDGADGGLYILIQA